jgi:centromere protein J
VPSVSGKVQLQSIVGLEREIPNEDGSVKRVFADGRQVVFFANGTIKEINSHETTIFFTNGDIKRTHQNGIIEYYYFDVETWQTTHPSGVELYHFAQTDQVELHAAGDEPKDKEILFPDGTIRRVYSNGFEEDVAGL